MSLLNNAYGYLMMNAVVLPGVGSWMAGKKVQGAFQVFMSLVGTFLTVLWVALWIGRMLETKEFTVFVDGTLLIGFLGALMFIVSWVWSVITGILLVKQAKTKLD